MHLQLHAHTLEFNDEFSFIIIYGKLLDILSHFFPQKCQMWFNYLAYQYHLSELGVEDGPTLYADPLLNARKHHSYSLSQTQSSTIQ